MEWFDRSGGQYDHDLDLTLERAATLAEFDADPDTVKTLVAAAKVGQFDHVAQRARDDRAQIAAYDQAAAQLAEQSVSVVAESDWDDPNVRDIWHLATTRPPRRRGPRRVPGPRRLRLRRPGLGLRTVGALFVARANQLFETSRSRAGHAPSW